MSDTYDPKRARAKRALPLWGDAFLRDTQHLAADEVGAYLLILMAMWVRAECNFPDSEDRLARVSRVSLRLWKSRVGPALRPFFKSEDGMLISKKLREEATYVERQGEYQHIRKTGGKADNQLNNKEPDASGDSSGDVSGVHPSQPPNLPTKGSEEDLSSSDAGGVETGFSKRIFEEGVALLERHGLTEKAARSQIGKWRKAHSDPGLTEAFAAFESAGATDPVSWITARLAPPPAAPSKERASTDAQVEFYAKMANGEGYVAPSAISAPMARLMLERGLVSPETLRSKGIAA